MDAEGKHRINCDTRPGWLGHSARFSWSSRLGQKRQVNSTMNTCKYIGAEIAYYKNKVAKTRELVGE
jgi:hypothetical protein